MHSDAFLCNHIARMGLQNTTNTRDACEQSDAFLCDNIYALQAQILDIWTNDLVVSFSKNYSTHALEKCFEKTRPTCCSVFQNLCLGSIIWQGWVYKTQQTREMHWWSSDLMMRCDVLLFWDAMIFCRGTRDYGMCEVNKASQCEHQATLKSSSLIP